MIMMTAFLRTSFGIPFRQLSGMVLEMLDSKYSPCYSTLARRIAKLDISAYCNKVCIKDKEGHVTVVAASTGFKQCNCIEWIREKWKIHRGFVKLHILADVDTQKIIALVITDERIGDAPVLKDLLRQAVPEVLDSSSDENDKRPNMLADGKAPLDQMNGVKETPRASILADGAYASRNNMKLCKDLGINPLMQMNHNCTTRGKGTGDSWAIPVRTQLGGSPDARIGLS